MIEEMSFFICRIFESISMIFVYIMIIFMFDAREDRRSEYKLGISILHCK